MYCDSQREPAWQRPVTVTYAIQPAVLVAVFVRVFAALLLVLPAAPALAANTHATLVQPAATGEARAARQAVLKQRSTNVPATARKPGKTVGGARTPLPKTVVTKRILPK